MAAAAGEPAAVVGARSLPESWSARQAYEHMRLAWLDEENCLKEVPLAEWPWGLWAEELSRVFQTETGVLPGNLCEATPEEKAAGAALVERMEQLAVALRSVVQELAGAASDSFAAAVKAGVPPKAAPAAAKPRDAFAALKSPAAHDNGKKRKVSIVEQTGGSAPKRGASASLASKESTVCKVKPADRIKEYPNESFEVDCNNKNMLWCVACVGQYGTLLKTVKQHVASEKHQANLAKHLDKQPQVRHQMNYSSELPF